MSRYHQTIEEAFVYYTDCQMATLSYLTMVKRTSKSELKRQQDIVNGMLDQIVRFKIPVDPKRYGARITKALEERSSQTASE